MPPKDPPSQQRVQLKLSGEAKPLFCTHVKGRKMGWFIPESYRRKVDSNQVST